MDLKRPPSNRFVLFSSILCLLNNPILAQQRGIQGVVPDPSMDEARTALVIGNGAYVSSPLRNPVNDVRAVASTLRSLGFTVISGENLTNRQMEEIIFEFGRKIKNGGVGLFYFSGHGVQVADVNYLIPIDAQIMKEQDFRFEAVQADRVLAEMEAAENRLNIVILDACRDNPFARSFRTTTRGLAVMTAPRGTIIEYSTAKGSVASDGEGTNGLFTEQLVKYMREPGLEIGQVFKRARSAVSRLSNGQQVPWEASSLEGDFFFILPSEIETADTPSAEKAAPPLPQVPAKSQAEIEFVFIRGGTFQMGDVMGDDVFFNVEKPVHMITVSDFYLGRTEVTVARYRAFCVATGRSMPSEPSWGWHDDHPVVNVNWNDAVAFCSWAGCRLPTEAEWEYAAREGGRDVRFGNGKNIADPSEINFDASALYKVPFSLAGLYRKKTMPVASFAPNLLGLYDLSGNVWEWCSDWYDENYYSRSPDLNPKGPVAGLMRVLRGGSWFFNPLYVRCAYRVGNDPGLGDFDRGFRVAR